MTSADLPRHLQFDRVAVENYLRAYPLARLIRSVLHDVERVPSGPVLLVGNHGPLAVDTGLLLHAFHRETGHVVRGLGDRMFFTNRIGRQLVRSVAGVEGSRENARALLADGQIVLVYPGGARETTRDPSQRYKLDWEGRLGFARMALEAKVPIVPVACIGSDDLFTQVFDSVTIRNSFAGRLVTQFIKPDYIPPLYVPKLRATQFHYFFGEPIAPLAVVNAAEGIEDEAVVRAHQQTVKAALEELVTFGRNVRRERLAAKQRIVA